MCNPILVTLLKIRLHYSQSSRENVTPSSGTSPLASFRKCLPPPTPGNEYEFEVEERRKEKKERFLPQKEKRWENWWLCNFFAGFKMYVHCVREGWRFVVCSCVPDGRGKNQETCCQDKGYVTMVMGEKETLFSHGNTNQNRRKKHNLVHNPWENCLSTSHLDINLWFILEDTVLPKFAAECRTSGLAKYKEMQMWHLSPLISAEFPL